MNRMYSHLDIVFILVILILTPAMITYDVSILRLLAGYRVSLLNVFIYYFTAFGNYLLAVIYGIYILVAKSKEELKRWVPVILIAYASWFLANGFVYALKNILRRPRPFVSDSKIDTICGRPKSYSFPSGHSQSAWSLVIPIIFEIKNKYLKIGLIAFAVLMSFSRIYCGVHYLSDVVWGALIGYLFSKVLYLAYIEKKIR